MENNKIAKIIKEHKLNKLETELMIIRTKKDLYNELTKRGALEGLPAKKLEKMQKEMEELIEKEIKINQKLQKMI